MNEIMQNITVVVSGCKNGYAMLAATPGTDLQSSSLRGALGDLRSHMRIMEPGHTFYTLSVQRGRYMLSALRSSIDSAGASGGYIAVSLWVPSDIRVESAPALLAAMLDAYWNEYMHPMFGTPLPGKLESVEPCLRVLQEHTSCFRPRRLRVRYTQSVHTAPPVLMTYTSLSTVEGVMANPFAAAYASGSTMIIMEESLRANPQTRLPADVRTVRPEAVTSTQGIDRLLLPTGVNFRITGFKADGVEYMSPGDVSLLPDTRLEYTVVLPSGESIPYCGTLEQALRDKLVSRKDEDYVLNPPLMQVHLRLEGFRPTADCRPVLRDSRGRRHSLLPGADGLWTARIPCLGLTYNLYDEAGRQPKLLYAKAVTADNATLDPIVLRMHATRPPSMDRTKAASDPRTKWLIAAGGALAAVLVVLAALWIFVWSGQEEEKRARTYDDDTEEEYTPVKKASEEIRLDSTVITVDPMAVRELMQYSDLHGKEWRGMPASPLLKEQGRWSQRDGFTFVLYNRVPGKDADGTPISAKDRKVLEGKNRLDNTVALVLKRADGSTVLLPLSRRNVAGYEDLMKYPHNKTRRFRVIPRGLEPPVSSPGPVLLYDPVKSAKPVNPKPTNPKPTNPTNPKNPRTPTNPAPPTQPTDQWNF